MQRFPPPLPHHESPCIKYIKNLLLMMGVSLSSQRETFPNTSTTVSNGLNVILILNFHSSLSFRNIGKTNRCSRFSQMQIDKSGKIDSTWWLSTWIDDDVPEARKGGREGGRETGRDTDLHSTQTKRGGKQSKGFSVCTVPAAFKVLLWKITGG